MSHTDTGHRARTTLVAALAGSLALVLAACSTSSKHDGSGQHGKVSITVNDEPPATAVPAHQQFLDDVAAFEKLHPDIDIIPHEGQMDPSTFAARLAGGQLENVFYTYFTDPASLIARHQAADVTSYLPAFPTVAQLKPDLMKIYSDSAGHVYGLPQGNYSLGLVYNRTLFQRAGLDPNTPPATWDEVRADAAKIAALGEGIVGYGDYSKSNTGGWHFTAEIYSLGGEAARQTDSGAWTADFNNDKGKQVLRQLHDMRWTDNSMGARQLLEWKDLLQMMGAGKLGMYLASSDNIPTIVSQYKGKSTDYGLGSIPGGVATLGGGAGFMFNPKDTPAQIKAGLTWLTYMYDNPDKSVSDVIRNAAAEQAVGLPEPDLWIGAAEQKFLAANEAHANVPTQNLQPFVDAAPKITVKIEPPQAQKIYAVLDTVMAAVLTNKSADIDKLLADAERQVNTILSTVH
jgi:ABC-type glycerol-3-phosphate transport system substrate-binding protein